VKAWDLPRTSPAAIQSGKVFPPTELSAENTEGFFKLGDNRGWAENTLLKERFLWEVGGSRQGKMNLEDAFTLLLTHNAGGYCQHTYENPGALAVTISTWPTCAPGISG